VTNAQFFAALVPPATQGDFATSSRLECAFVGSKTSLLAEMQASFAAPSDENDFVPGNLIDLLRPRNVYSFGQTFRSIIHSPASRRPPPADAGKPWCTIFDSTLGYLKWNHCYPASHQIILLDRAEANYEDSVNHLNQRYYQRPTDPQGLFNAATVQPGMTIISFAEATHD
jgi:hypothetical protein